jgi:acyl-CoA reductase-like NAD-dependent aldehyde dehydrogenase
MGEILDFIPRAKAPTPEAWDGQAEGQSPWDADEALVSEAYAAAYAAAERYKREQRKERELHSRIDALMRENAKLRAELAARG